jgi:hypothetical protein
MRPFLYRCRTTGAQVHAWVAAESRDDERTFETVKCAACQRIHIVNLKKGRVLGDDAPKGSS